MNEHKGSILGMITTWLMAALTSAFAHFENHVQAYTGAMAILVGLATLANIFFGPFSSKRRKNETKDSDL